MSRYIAAWLLGIMAVGTAPVAYAGEDGQEYVVFRLKDGTSVMEKAWVVSSRIIITTPFEMDAYLAESDGVFTGSKSGVKYLTRNRFKWLKVYTSDHDLAVSGEVPEEIVETLAGLSSAIEKAGGLEKFRSNMRPFNGGQKRKAPVVTVHLDKYFGKS